jgi:hypothetical protein
MAARKNKNIKIVVKKADDFDRKDPVVNLGLKEVFRNVFGFIKAGGDFG